MKNTTFPLFSPDAEFGGEGGGTEKGGLNSDSAQFPGYEAMQK